MCAYRRVACDLDLFCVVVSRRHHLHPRPTTSYTAQNLRCFCCVCLFMCIFLLPLLLTIHYAKTSAATASNTTQTSRCLWSAYEASMRGAHTRPQWATQDEISEPELLFAWGMVHTKWEGKCVCFSFDVNLYMCVCVRAYKLEIWRNITLIKYLRRKWSKMAFSLVCCIKCTCPFAFFSHAQVTKYHLINRCAVETQPWFLRQTHTNTHTHTLTHAHLHIDAKCD